MTQKTPFEQLVSYLTDVHSTEQNALTRSRPARRPPGIAGWRGIRSTLPRYGSRNDASARRVGARGSVRMRCGRAVRGPTVAKAARNDGKLAANASSISRSRRRRKCASSPTRRRPGDRRAPSISSRKARASKRDALLVEAGCITSSSSGCTMKRVSNGPAERGVVGDRSGGRAPPGDDGQLRRTRRQLARAPDERIDLAAASGNRVTTSRPSSSCGSRARCGEITSTGSRRSRSRTEGIDVGPSRHRLRWRRLAVGDVAGPAPICPSGQRGSEGRLRGKASERGPRAGGPRWTMRSRGTSRKTNATI